MLLSPLTACIRLSFLCSKTVFDVIVVYNNLYSSFIVSSVYSYKIPTNVSVFLLCLIIKIKEASQLIIVLNCGLE